VPKTESSSTLRQELESKILNGRCAYCRRPAEPHEPLTREHVIPRAKGGGRKDVRIIVPACARCNSRRGCQELALFLILRPRRISAFLDYLHSLSEESIKQMDLRVFAELYAALWMLSECASRGRDWRAQLRRMSAGRTLHRRRYAARRVVRDVGGRLEQRRGRPEATLRTELVLPTAAVASLAQQLDEPLEVLATRLMAVLSLVWQVSAEEVGQEIARQLRMNAIEEAAAAEPAPADAVLPLDGFKRRRSRQRFRVDRRRGRAA
jgi:hypothetical protein